MWGRLLTIEQYSFVANKLMSKNNEQKTIFPNRIEEIISETKIAPVIVLVMRFFIIYKIQIVANVINC